MPRRTPIVSTYDPSGQTRVVAAAGVSLVAGMLLCIPFIPGIVAIAAGVIGVRQADRLPGVRGRGVAMSGIALGVVSLLLWTAVAVLTPQIRAVLASERSTASMSRLRALGMSIERYTQLHAGHYPPDAQTLRTFAGPGLMNSPLARDEGVEYVYLPDHIAGRRRMEIADASDVLIAYEPLDLHPTTPGQTHKLYADGRVEFGTLETP